MGREPGRSYKMSLDLALKDGLNLGARRRKGHDVRKGRDGGRGFAPMQRTEALRAGLETNSQNVILKRPLCRCGSD